jgi:hypothetical protein
LRLLVFLICFVSLSAREFSLLEQADLLGLSYSAKKIGEEYPYAYPHFLPCLEKYSAWFSPSKNRSDYLSYLISLRCQQEMEDLGMDALDIGSLFQTTQLGSSVAGGSSPVSMEIDQKWGNKEALTDLENTAAKMRKALIGTIDAGTTGWGQDFHLALRNIPPFPGIYHLIEIEPCDWDLLPYIPEKSFVQGLSKSEVQLLSEKKYILPLANHCPCYQNQVQWYSTAPIEGLDGKSRRWVYLSFEGAYQPCMNWTDSSFTAQRIFSGYVMYLVGRQKNQIVTIDANRFLGLERTNNHQSPSNIEPLLLTAVETMAQQTRKFGGTSALDINIPLSDLSPFFVNGPEFIYDISTKKAFFQSLSQKSALPLLTMYELLLEQQIPIYRTIRVLGLNHNTTWQSPCSEKTQEKTTTINLLSDLLPVDLYHLKGRDKQKLQKAYLLYAFFMTMQPGIIKIDEEFLLGKYELCDCDESKCSYLYRPVLAQLKDPFSLCSQMKLMIKARKLYHLQLAQLCRCYLFQDDLFIALFKLPQSKEPMLIACNFGEKPKEQLLSMPEFMNSWAVNILSKKSEKKRVNSSEFLLKMDSFEGKAIHFQPKID